MKVDCAIDKICESIRTHPIKDLQEEADRSMQKLMELAEEHKQAYEVKSNSNSNLKQDRVESAALKQMIDCDPKVCMLRRCLEKFNELHDESNKIAAMIYKRDGANSRAYELECKIGGKFKEERERYQLELSN